MAAERAARQSRMLIELAEIGMDIARALRREALARAGTAERGEEAKASGDPGLSFARVSRAVRLTVALEARLADEAAGVRAPVKAVAAKAVAAAPAPFDPTKPFDIVTQGAEAFAYVKQTLKRKVWENDIQPIVEEVVEKTIEDEREAGLFGEREAENLRAEFRERLDEYDVHYLEPTGRIIAMICRDLGISPKWDLWEDDLWAIEEIRTQPEGSPYTARPGVPLPPGLGIQRGHPPSPARGASP